MKVLALLYEFLPALVAAIICMTVIMFALGLLGLWWYFGVLRSG